MTYKLIALDIDGTIKNLNKEISVNISEIDTKVSDVISDFTLIGFIKDGKFNKIIIFC